MIRKAALVVLLVAPFCAPVGAWAQSCTVSATGLAFGAYIPSSPTAATATGTVTVNCNSTLALLISYTIAINPGLYSGGGFANRRMAGGSSFLAYQLYSDAAMTQIWGDGTGGTTTVSGSCLINLLGLLCSSSNTVYGRLPARQSPAPGAYTDTVTVTISY